MSDWIEYKSQLLRAYFSGGNSLAPPDSQFHREFLAFLSRFEMKTAGNR